MIDEILKSKHFDGLSKLPKPVVKCILFYLEHMFKRTFVCVCVC